jgi:hypothetical protein
MSQKLTHSQGAMLRVSLMHRSGFSFEADQYRGMATIRDKLGHIAVSGSLCAVSDSFLAESGPSERSSGCNLTY